MSLITDAMAAAGMADGAYRLGPLAVDVVDGAARVSGTDTIAGGTATMDCVFRFAVTHSGFPRDEALMLAVRQSSINPARALGLPCPVSSLGPPPTWWCWTQTSPFWVCCGTDHGPSSPNP